jgi:hypothetical protein
MGVLANLRFGLQRARHRGNRPCSHLDQIHQVTRPRPVASPAWTWAIPGCICGCA